MATAKAEDGVAQSPGEKVNGDGDLDYTITMNESEEDASSDDASTSKAIRKTNGTPSSPLKVNGKMTSDEDSLSAIAKDVKANKAEQVKENNKEDCGSKQKTEDDEVNDTEAQDSKTKTQDECEEQGEKDDKEEKCEDKQEQEKMAEGESAQSREKEGNSASAEPKETDKNLDCQTDVPDKDDETEDNTAKQSESVKGTVSVKNSVEDEVVEIDDSPMKQPIGKSLEFSAGSQGARDVAAHAPFVKVCNSGVSNASFLPYLNSMPGTSLLTSTAGMHLVHVQGAGLMYVPSSSGVQGSVTSTTAFNSSLGGISKGHAHSTSLYMPPYTNTMAGQNRFMMSGYNQGMKSGMPAAPVLTNIPEKPTSSIGMIENIRWEVENHINIKPKYAKPNPKAELGHLAKWIFDLGSDLVKEFVYHDLVRIQHSRNSEGSLTAKEKDDFAKLQEIDKELNNKIGHLKIKLNKSCKCGFRTELNNVLYNHQQHAHIERGGFFNCIHCKFSTRQPSTFKFHMESIHARPGFVENRPSFFECPLCPYETNYNNRLDQHKVRCLRQFREAFNLHPSCILGPEVNLCLENVFYYVFTRQFMNSIMPKPLTPIISSATKIRDMANNEAANMQTRRGMPNTPTQTMTSTAKQIVPKTQTFQVGQAQATVKQQLQVRSAVSRSFPVMSSKINMVPNKPVASTYTTARAPIQTQPQNQPSASNQAPNQPNNGFEVCEICGGYVKDRKALRIHFFYAHRIDMPFGVFERPQAPLYCATCFARFWTAQGLQKHIEVHKNDMMGTTQTSNGVAGKCISCGHRVPNILMHMRMVHNRELRHYLAALMCIFCGSRFATKKEVETHMGKMHGVIVKNSSVQGAIDKPQPGAQTVVNSSPQQPKVSAPVQKAASEGAKPGSKGGKSRSSQCVLCNLSFSRNVDLTRHCMRVHHTCMKCGLVVVDKESLARHTCLHSASGMRTCQICKESGFHPAYYIKHMRDKHLRKCSVVLRHIDRAVVETMKRPITISDSEEEEEEPAEKPTESKRQKTDDEVAADHKDTKKEIDSSSYKKDSDSKIKEIVRESGMEKDEEKVNVETNQEEEEKQSDQTEGNRHELKDTQESDSKSAVNDNENDSKERETCEDNDDSRSRQVDSEDKTAECHKVDHEGGDDEGSRPERQSAALDVKGTSEKQCEESSGKKNVKRKIDEVDGADDVKDSAIRKSQRRSSQFKENQD